MTFSCIHTESRSSKLTQNEMAKHVEMCWWFESKIEEMSAFLQNVWFSDEAVAITFNCGTNDKKGN